MKTCSDSLKALLHQYRTGEKKTWYIADLYNIWLNSPMEKGLSWQPSIEGDLLFVPARYDKGIYMPLQTGFDSRIKVTTPPPEIMNWNGDWTIEFFIQMPWDSSYYGDEAYSNVVCFAIGGSSLTDSKGLSVVFWNGDNLGDTGGNIQANYDIYGVWTGNAGNTWSGWQEWNHVAFYKKDDMMFCALNGYVVDATYLHGDTIDLSPYPYMHILAPDSATYRTSAIIDEFRISTCARYTIVDPNDLETDGNEPSNTKYTVPTAPFTPDEYTLSLLHLNGNLDDEGLLGSVNLVGNEVGGGEIFLYTGHDTDLTCGGNKYRHITIEHGDIEESKGTETATMDLTINYSPMDTIAPDDERTWFKAFKDGVFDKAYISLDRLYSPIPWRYNMPNIPIDYVLKSRFFGRMDVQEVKLDHATIQVKSPTDMLNKELPRNLVKPSCLNHFGDFMCQVDAKAYKKAVTSLVGSSQGRILISNTVSGNYNNGMLYCTGGKNKGQFASIKTYSNGEIVLFKPFLEEVQTGDTFDMMAGCDKTMATCRDQYANLGHFRGFPFLPCKNVLL